MPDCDTLFCFDFETHPVLDNLRVYHRHALSADQIISEIFEEKLYHFDCTKPDPLIIDAGANIGIATLFFKRYYPQSTVIAFEPDPYMFELLQKNVEANHLSGVKLINAALSRVSGTLPFFGELSQQGLDTRGNSLLKGWGLQRKTGCEIMVKSVRLSDYINENIEFLKLDIEGAEQQVLEELSNARKLSQIHEMAIEVHEADGIRSVNQQRVIQAFLRRHHFRVTVIKKNVDGIFPEETAGWVNQANPALFYVRAEAETDKA